MITLLVAMLLTSPSPPARAAVPLKHCIRGCVEMRGHIECFYEELRACAKRQPECVDTETVDCKNWVTRLGTWDPIPDGYQPQADGQYRQYPATGPELKDVPLTPVGSSNSTKD